MYHSFERTFVWVIMCLWIGMICIAIVAAVAGYILRSLAYQKALRAMHYQNEWMAWIPYGRTYALTECTRYTEVNLIGNVVIPMKWFRFWWILGIFLPPILSTVWIVLCLGWTYTKVYAVLDGKDDKDVSAFAYLSALFGIVAVVKFLCIKNLSKNN